MLTHPKDTNRFLKNSIFACLFLAFLLSCSKDKSELKEEHVSILPSNSPIDVDSLGNSIQGNVSLNQIATTPQSVILTGIPDHRLITVYKTKKDGNPRGSITKYSRDYYGEMPDKEYHFMPGIDLIYGYNLINLAHYSFKTEKHNYLFNHPVLIKSIYYPSFNQDSLNKKPINRDYYLVSVYDEDTNKDTLINKKDLRRFYHFTADCSVKTQIIPDDYSVVRSEYDSKNDVMYIFARRDTNKNGNSDKKEPLHIFWISLKSPSAGKLMY